MSRKIRKIVILILRRNIFNMKFSFSNFRPICKCITKSLNFCLVESAPKQFFSRDSFSPLSRGRVQTFGNPELKMLTLTVFSETSFNLYLKIENVI